MELFLIDNNFLENQSFFFFVHNIVVFSNKYKKVTWHISWYPRLQFPPKRLETISETRYVSIIGILGA